MHFKEGVIVHQSNIKLTKEYLVKYDVHLLFKSKVRHRLV